MSGIPEMTFNKVINQLLDFGRLHKQINNTGFGNLIEFSRNNKNEGEDPSTGDPITTSYPLMFITPQNITYNRTTTTYDVSIIFGDILQEGGVDGQQVISNMSLLAKDLISYLTLPSPNPAILPDFYDSLDITLPLNAIPFQERFNDYIGGVSIDISFVVKDGVYTCEDIIEVD